ncbi:MAG: DUF1501 domain-containing protein [Acidobacteriota bacterium]
MLTRRFFLKSGALAIAGIGTGLCVPSFLKRTALAASEQTKSTKTLIVLFQRGAADGLNIVVPFGEAAYYSVRPQLSIAKPKTSDEQSAIDLDGFFGLHPALKPFKSLYDARQLAIVHAAGSPDSTRSHFDAQDYMETGTPGIKSTADGWLNRYLQGKKIVQASPLRAVAMGNKQPRALAGDNPSITLANLGAFDVRGGGGQASSVFESMYGKSDDKRLHPTGNEAFEAMRIIKRLRANGYTPANGADYPRGQFGASLRQIAQLIKADVGLEVAFADMGGWDTHTTQGAAQGRLAFLLREFSSSISAFTQDLGDRMNDVVIITLSEFGRTVQQNGNLGTDHGHATCMFVLGGKVRGGKVYGRWPGLEREQLYEGRDLALTTDFRSVCTEVLMKHFGISDSKRIFPGFQAKELLSLMA